MNRWLVILVVIALFSGCKREGPPRPNRTPPPPQPSITAPSSSVRTERPPQPVPSAVVRQRERDLVIPARRTPSQTLAMSRRRIAVLGERHLVVWQLENWKLVAKVPIRQPRAVVAMADGAFVVVTGSETLRLEQHETKPARLPRLMLLPGSQLWPDRRDPLTLWVPLGRTLHQYALPGPDEPIPNRLIPIASHALPDHDEQAFAGLKDGSFFFTAEDELVKFFPEGKSVRGPTPIAGRDVWRLLSATRIDRAWVAAHDGGLRLVEFAANFAVARELQIAGTLYDIAANDHHFAVTRTHHQTGKQRQWSVVLLDANGRSCFEHPLPAGPRPDAEDWVARETLNRNVALAPDDSCLAVGGPTWLSVWEIDSGQALLSADVTRRELTTSTFP